MRKTERDRIERIISMGRPLLPEVAELGITERWPEQIGQRRRDRERARSGGAVRLPPFLFRYCDNMSQ